MKCLSLVSTFDLGFAARRFTDHREWGQLSLAGGSAKPEPRGAARIEQIKPHQADRQALFKSHRAPVGG